MALVFFGNPFDAWIVFDDIGGGIGRAAINDEVFNVRIILIGHAFEGGVDSMGGVEARGDNGDCER